MENALPESDGVARGEAEAEDEDRRDDVLVRVHRYYQICNREYKYKCFFYTKVYKSFQKQSKLCHFG